MWHLRNIVKEAVGGAVTQGRRRKCWGGRWRVRLLEVHVGEGLAEKVAGPRDPAMAIKERALFLSMARV